MALVVGNMIGSGVFLLPSSLAALGGGLSMVGWGLSAGGSILLALVFARLARRRPAGGRSLRLHARGLRRRGGIPRRVELLDLDLDHSRGHRSGLRGLPGPVRARPRPLTGLSRLARRRARLGHGGCQPAGRRRRRSRAGRHGHPQARAPRLHRARGHRLVRAGAIHHRRAGRRHDSRRRVPGRHPDPVGPSSASRVGRSLPGRSSIPIGRFRGRPSRARSPPRAST